MDINREFKDYTRDYETIKALRNKLDNFRVQLDKDKIVNGNAIYHVNELINSNARVELFGDTYVSEKIYKEAKDAVQGMLTLLNEYKDIYELMRDEEAVKELKEYGFTAEVFRG